MKHRTFPLVAVCVAVGFWLIPSRPGPVRSGEANLGPNPATFVASDDDPIPGVDPLLGAVVTTRPTRVPTQHVVADPIEHTTTTLPSWTGPIPAYYGGDTGCTIDEASIVAATMRTVGATDDSILWMLTVMSRESTCDPAAHNGNRATGDDSWGLCQLNALAGFFADDGLLAGFDRTRFAVDFAYNVDACIALWQVCGRGPWTPPYSCSPPEELR